MAGDPVEIKVTSKRGIGFFIRVGKNFMEGTEKNGPVDNIVVSGLGNAINCAVAVATSLESDKLAKITNIATHYPSMESSGDHPGRGVPQIRVSLARIA